MNTVAFLFTGFALICAVACGACAWIAYENARDIIRSKSRLVSCEHELELLDAKVHKLRQKIYSSPREKQETEIVPASGLQPVCENWLLAQTDGPASTAAKCACDYCIAKRNDRDAARAKLVPKTHAERRDAIEKGRH